MPDLGECVLFLLVLVYQLNDYYITEGASKIKIRKEKKYFSAKEKLNNLEIDYRNITVVLYG